MTTVIEAANAVLLSINERPLPNLSSLVGQQVRNALKSAVQVMNEESDWPWLLQDRPAINWSLDSAFVGDDVNRIKLVQYRAFDGTWESVPYVDRDTYDEWPLEASTTLQIRDPDRYTTSGYSTVLVNAYPTDDTQKARFRFRILRNAVLPTSELEALDMPEQFVQALIKRACQEFALRHAEDAQISQMFQAEYQNEIDVLKQRHRIGSVNNYSMYRGNRRKR